MDALEAKGAPGRLADFAKWLLTPGNTRIGNGASLSNYLSQVRQHLRVFDGVELQFPPALSTAITRLRQRPYNRNNKQPVNVLFIKSILHDVNIALPVRMAIALSFRLGLRIHELLPHRHPRSKQWMIPVWRSGVQRDPVDGHYSIKLLSSKSDKYNAGADIIVVNTGRPNCITEWLRVYLSSLPRHGADTPLFIHSRDRFVLYPEVLAAMKSHAHVIGLKPEDVGTHSNRIGSIFTMKDAGLQWDLIDAIVRWSPTAAAQMHLVYDRMSTTRLLRAAVALDGTSSSAAPVSTAAVSNRLQPLFSPSL